MLVLGEGELVFLDTMLGRSCKIQSCFSQEYRVRVSYEVGRSPLTSGGIDFRQEAGVVLSTLANKNKT